jgi:hypothetical protein
VSESHEVFPPGLTESKLTATANSLAVWDG